MEPAELAVGMEVRSGEPDVDEKGVENVQECDVATVSGSGVLEADQKLESGEKVSALSQDVPQENDSENISEESGRREESANLAETEEGQPNKITGEYSNIEKSKSFNDTTQHGSHENSSEDVLLEDSSLEAEPTRRPSTSSFNDTTQHGSQEKSSEDVGMEDPSLGIEPIARPSTSPVDSEAQVVAPLESLQQQAKNTASQSENEDESSVFKAEDINTSSVLDEIMSYESEEAAVKLVTSDAAGENCNFTAKEAELADDEMEIELPKVLGSETVKCDSVSTQKESCAQYYLPLEKETSFSVSDLVWGKVRSHPWWPAQVFDPSDASETALKYRKRDSYLVAYFGDKTFAWNDASQLRPFRTHFTQMEKQSNLAAFVNAVECALDEVSRRVEFGLACYCIPDEVYDRIKSQSMVNAGLRKGASVADSAYGSLNMTALEPDKLVQYIKELAIIPSGGGGRLDLTIAKAQLLSFYRSKGYPKLPEFYIHSWISESVGNLSYMRPKSLDRSSGKRKKHAFVDRFANSKKRRSLSDLMDEKKSSKTVKNSMNCKIVDPVFEDSQQRRRRRSLSELMDEEKVQNHEKGSKISKNTDPISAYSGQLKKRKTSLLSDADNNKSPLSVKKSFNIGECISRIASRLTGSSPILKARAEKSEKNGGKADQSRDKDKVLDLSVKTPERIRRRKASIKTEHFSPKEMLSQLCLAARDPLKGYSFVYKIVGFFSDYRDELCRDNCRSGKQKKLAVGETGGGKSAKSDKVSSEIFKFEDGKDSYWTDRIVHSSEEPTKKSELGLQAQLGDRNLSTTAHQELLEGKQGNEYSPTALTLKFSEAESLPSESDLRNIFSKYGPLKESETEVLRKTKRVKVVFMRRADAEAAFSSSGKFSIFGPTLVSYKLSCLPSHTKSSHTTKSRIDATPVDNCTPMAQPEGEVKFLLPEISNKMSQIPEKDENQTNGAEPPLSQGSQLPEKAEDQKNEAKPSFVDGYKQVSELTQKGETLSECSVEYRLMEEGIPVSQLPAKDELQTQSAAEFPLNGSKQMAALPEMDEMQTECGSEISSLKDINQMAELPLNGSKQMAALPEMGEMQTECGAEISSLEDSNQMSLQFEMGQIQTESGDKLPSIDNGNQMSQLPEDDETQLDCTAEVPHMEGGNPVEGENLTNCAVELTSTEDRTQMNQPPGNNNMQTECDPKLTSMEDHNQMPQLPGKSETQTEHMSDFPSMENGNQVTELLEEAEMQTECGAKLTPIKGTKDIFQFPENGVIQTDCRVELLFMDNCNQIAQLLEKGETQIECSSKLSLVEGENPVSQLPKNGEMQAQGGAELSFIEVSSQISQTAGKDEMQTEHRAVITSMEASQMTLHPEKGEIHRECRTNTISIENCSQMFKLPEKSENQTECSAERSSMEGGSPVSQLPEKGEMETQCVADLTSVEDGNQMIQLSEKSEMRAEYEIHTDCRTDTISIENCSQVIQLPEKGEIQTESCAELLSIEGGSPISHLPEKGEMESHCVTELPSVENSNQMSELFENSEMRAQCGVEFTSKDDITQMPQLTEKGKMQTECIEDDHDMSLPEKDEKECGSQAPVEIQGSDAEQNAEADRQGLIKWMV